MLDRSRPGAAPDSAAVTAASVVAATLVAQQVAGKAARDALFLTAFNVSSLPAMMIVSAALSALSAILFARAMRRSSPARSLTFGLVAFALLSVGCGLASEEWPQLVAAAFYLQITLFGAVLLSAFWSVVNERFDPYTARQTISRIAGGATFGGVVGGLFAWLAARYVSVAGLLYALALGSALCIAGLRRLGGVSGTKARPPGDLDEMATGLGVFRNTPYLKDLALLVGLGSLVDALLDYALKSEAAARYSGGDALFTFFSAYAALLGIVTFAAQALLSRPALTRLGLGGTVALQPGGVFLLTLLGALEPGLLAATLARGGAAALRDSVFRSGYELLYTPLPPTLKRASKAVVDVAVDRLGTVLGSAITLVVAYFLPRPTGLLLTLAAGLALVATSICRRLHRGYVLALETNLRIGVVQVSPEEVLDGTTLAVTRTALGLDRQALLAEIRALRGEASSLGAVSDSPGAVSEEEPLRSDDPFLLAVADLRSKSRDRIRSLLGRPEGADPALVSHLIPLLVRRDIAPDILRALRPRAAKITGQLVDALLDPGSEPALRRRVARILKSSPTARSVEGLLLGLADPDLSVRVECGKVLGAIKTAEPTLVVRKDAVFDAVQRELLSPEAGVGSVALDHAFALLSLVLETEPVLISLQALRGGDSELRGTALEYLDNVLPRHLRDALWPRLGATVRGAPSTRASQEVERELLQSMSGMSAIALRRALLRPTGRALPKD
jgi:MFS family permease